MTNSSAAKDRDTPASPRPKAKDDDPLLSPTSSRLTKNSVALAGRVLENQGKCPQETSIRFLCLEDIGVAPQEAQVDSGGYFQISDIKPGKRYKLEARAKSGDRVVAGIAYVKAPNIHVEINMREEFAGPQTPVAQNPEMFLPGANRDKQSPPTSSNPPAVTMGPLSPPPGQRTSMPTVAASNDNAGNWIGKGVASPLAITGDSAVLNVAINIPIPDANDAPPPPPRGFVDQSKPGAWPPTLDMGVQPKIDRLPPPNFPTSVPTSPAPELGRTPVTGDLNPAQVPSAVVVGRQLVNFALTDAQNGSAWELKRNRASRLVLLDFWFTTCLPCQASIPELNALQSRYPSATLEVVGIANEQHGRNEDKRLAVVEMCAKKKVGYRQLLDSNYLTMELNVKSYPTLLLLDEQGYIVWRHEGVLNASTARELDRVIQNHLNRVR